MSNEYFLGKGAGDLYIKAECVFLTKTFEVQDKFIYDLCTSDKTSNYGTAISIRPISSQYTANCYLSYDSRNSKYEMLPNATGYGAIIPISILNGVDDVKIEYDSLNSGYARYIGFGLCTASGNDAVGRTYQDSQYMNFTTVNGTYTETSTMRSSTYNKWIHNVITVTNGQINMKVYDGTTLLSDETYNISSTVLADLHYGFIFLGNNTSSPHFYIKNIDAEPL